MTRMRRNITSFSVKTNTIRNKNIWVKCIIICYLRGSSYMYNNVSPFTGMSIRHLVAQCLSQLRHRVPPFDSYVLSDNYMMWHPVDAFRFCLT
jgi:hypothetical protein